MIGLIPDMNNLGPMNGSRLQAAAIANVVPVPNVGIAFKQSRTGDNSNVLIVPDGTEPSHNVFMVAPVR